MTRSPRLILADDHPIVAEALARYLADHCELVAVVNSGPELVEAVKQHRPDAVVTDMSMPGMNGLDAMKRLRAEGHKAPFIFLTMHADAALAGEAMRAGAGGYLLKDSAGEELHTAITEVLRGRTYLTPLMTAAVLDAVADPVASPVQRLSARQREVLRLVASGRSMKQIAAELNLSPRTVETHKYEMMRTLGIESTAALVKFAIQHHLAD